LLASRDSFNVSVGWDLEPIACVALKVCLLFVQDLLDGLANIIIELLDESLLLLILADAFLHIAVGLIDDLVVKLQLFFLAL